MLGQPWLRCHGTIRVSSIRMLVTVGTAMVLPCCEEKSVTVTEQFLPTADVISAVALQCVVLRLVQGLQQSKGPSWAPAILFTLTAAIASQSNT